MLSFQVLDKVFVVASNICLSAFTGAVVNFMSMVRNYLAYKNILTKTITIIILIVTSVISFSVNQRGFIGWLPIIATAEYTLWLGFGTNTVKSLKIALIINLLLWAVYDLTIYAFSTFCYDVVITATTAYSLYKMKNESAEKKSF